MVFFLWYCDNGSDVVEGCEVFKLMLTRNTRVIGNVYLLILFLIRKMTLVGTEGSRCLWACIGHRLLKFFHTEGNSRQERVSSDHAMRSESDGDYKSNSCLEQEAAQKLRYCRFSTNSKQSKCMDQRIFELDRILLIFLFDLRQWWCYFSSSNGKPWEDMRTCELRKDCCLCSLDS